MSKSSAAMNGKWAEDKLNSSLDDLVKTKTIQRYKYSYYCTLKQNELPNVFIVKQYPIKRYWHYSGYTPKKEHFGRTEFVLFIKNGESYKKIRIECKYQGVSGSTMDKLPMSILDMKCRPTDEQLDKAYIVIFGEELEKRIEQIKQMASDLQSKSLPSSEVDVVNLSGFLRDITTNTQIKNL